jgi:fructokinase
MDVDVVTLGEALVDFIPVPDAGQWRFLARAGGAPANVAAGLARLGCPTAFVGRVGADALGTLVVEAVASAGVVVRWIRADPVHPTTVAIVMPGTDTHARFLIYRAADARLEPDDVPLDVIRTARMLHVGTLSMAAPTSRRATLAAVQTAREAGVPVSLDVNLRPAVWEDRRKMLAATRELTCLATIVKVTRDEIEAIGASEAELLALGPRIVLVTDGGSGAWAATETGTRHCGAQRVDVVDSTGAGDAFMAAFIRALLDRGAGSPSMSRSDAPWSGADQDAVDRALGIAVWAGSVAVQRVGAMESLPTAAELSARAD